MNAIPDLNNLRRPLTKRVAAWLLTPRITRRVLLGLAGVVTLVVLVYLRVNTHGKSEWENYKRSMAAKGDSLDWSAFAPKPVPDDQNIFQAPGMAAWFDDPRGILAQPLEHRTTNSFARRMLNPKSTANITTEQAAAEYLAWSDQFQGDFDTITAALKRPYGRIVADYSQPFAITLPNVTTLNAVVKTLVQRAKCHLLLRQADKAWQQLSLLHDMRRMLENQGKFIIPEGDWMRREMAKHSLEVIARGLELHAWTEPQVRSLQEQLRDSDFIALHVEALKCARSLLTSSLETGVSEDGNLYKAMFTAGGNNFWTRIKRHPEFVLMVAAPRGAMYERATSLGQRFQKMTDALSPADGVLRPAEVSRAFAGWKRAQESLPSLLRIQSLANEGQIACALERYRLAEGIYPANLDALVPSFIEKLPLDLVNGRSLIYHRTEDGGFQLYSVGWNESDDGGKDVSRWSTAETLGAGDWSWSTASQAE